MQGKSCKWSKKPSISRGFPRFPPRSRVFQIRAKRCGYGFSLQIQLVIAVFDQADPAHDLVDGKGQNRRQRDVQQQNLPQNGEAESHVGECADGADEWRVEGVYV